MTAPIANEAAEWLTAIGTVGAVVLALILAAGPAIKGWRTRPTLTVEVGLTEPFIRPIPSERTMISEVRLRVRVRNAGRSPALGVRAQLLRWWEYDAKESLGAEWQELDCEPLYLHWVTLRPGDDRPGPPEVTIVEGATDLLDVALLGSDRRTRLLLDDERLAQFQLAAVERVGTWRVEFAVGAANCEIMRHTVEFRVDGNNYFSAVRLCEPPAHSIPTGLLALLGSMQDSSSTPDDGSDED